MILGLTCLQEWSFGNPSLHDYSEDVVSVYGEFDRWVGKEGSSRRAEE